TVVKQMEILGHNTMTYVIHTCFVQQNRTVKQIILSFKSFSRHATFLQYSTRVAGTDTIAVPQNVCRTEHCCRTTTSSQDSTILAGIKTPAYLQPLCTKHCAVIHIPRINHIFSHHNMYLPVL